jgi:hypothetical protein
VVSLGFMPTLRRRNLITLFSVISIGLAATLVDAVSWSDYEMRLTTYNEFDGIPDIVQTSDGAIWIFWSRNNAENYDIFYTISFDEGLSWYPETRLTEDSAANTGVSVLQASNGSIWLVWSSDRTGSYEIFYKTSPDFGASWSNDTQLTFDSSFNLKPEVYQLSNGSIWVLWHSDRSGDYELYLKTYSDAGSSWSSATRLTADASIDKMPSVFETSDGLIWIVWSSDRTGKGDLYCMAYNGSAWSEATQLTSGPNIDTNPNAVKTLDGKIWIFFSSRQSSESATDDVYYMCSSDNGVTWSGDVQFTTDSYDDMWPSAIQARDTRIWLVWTSDRADQPDWGNWDIYYRTSLVGDLNEDGVVDILDLSILGMAYGTFEWQPGYNADADINSDGIVDGRDLALVTVNFGDT